jgi:hypothetical protein
MRLSGEDEAEKGERNCAEEGDNVIADVERCHFWR